MTVGLETETQPILKRLLRYVRPYRFVIIPAAIAIVVYALVTGLVPFFVEDIFERFQVEALASAEGAETDAERSALCDEPGNCGRHDHRDERGR